MANNQINEWPTKFARAQIDVFDLKNRTQCMNEARRMQFLLETHVIDLDPVEMFQLARTADELHRAHLRSETPTCNVHDMLTQLGYNIDIQIATYMIQSIATAALLVIMWHLLPESV